MSTITLDIAKRSIAAVAVNQEIADNLNDPSRLTDLWLEVQRHPGLAEGERRAAHSQIHEALFSIQRAHNTGLFDSN